MPQENKYVNDEFTMKESIGTNLTIGVVFLILFILVFYNIFLDEHPDLYHSNKGIFDYIFTLFFLIPGLGFLVKSFYRRNIVTINKNGFYHYDEFKTNWSNFIGAEVEERETRRAHYYFVFIIRFNVPNEGAYELTIRLNSTYNKSGEEIIEAIKYFRPLPPLTSELPN